MPTLLQASIRSVPAGAATFLSSTVMFNRAIGSCGADVPRRLCGQGLALRLCSHSKAATPHCRNLAGTAAYRGGRMLALGHHRLDRSRFLEWARPALQMIFELPPELLDESHGRHGGGVAQRAERPAQHVFRKVVHVVDVFFQTSAGMEAGERLS